MRHAVGCVCALLAPGACGTTALAEHNGAAPGVTSRHVWSEQQRGCCPQPAARDAMQPLSCMTPSAIIPLADLLCILSSERLPYPKGKNRTLWLWLRCLSVCHQDHASKRVDVFKDDIFGLLLHNNKLSIPDK